MKRCFRAKTRLHPGYSLDFNYVNSLAQQLIFEVFQRSHCVFTAVLTGASIGRASLLRLSVFLSSSVQQNHFFRAIISRLCTCCHERFDFGAAAVSKSCTETTQVN